MIRFKRWICLLLAVSMVLAMVPITAHAETYSGICGENLTWVLDEAGTLTISGSGPMTDYSSSSKIPWYSNRDQITEIVIGDGVTTTGSRAFYYCSNLETVTIGDGVTRIGASAFYECRSLNDLVIGDSVEVIGDKAFSGCVSLTGADIPAGVMRIDSHAFSNCSGLTDITFHGDAPDFFGDYAFDNVTATVFYPTDNGTWTDDVKKNYGGTITWVEYDPHVLAENEHILFFRKWDGEDRIAYFAHREADEEALDIAVMVTDILDSAVTEALITLVDTYVLARIQPMEEGSDYDGVLLAITPLQTGVGIVTAIGENTIYIDDVAYPLSDILYPLSVSVGDMVIFNIYNDGIVELWAYDGSIPAPEIPALPEPEYRMELSPQGDLLYVEVGKTLEVICDLYYGDEKVKQWAKPQESIAQELEAVTAAGWKKQNDGSYVLMLSGVTLGEANVAISEATGGTAAAFRIKVVPPTGNGTKEYPYRIASESDFAAIAQAPDAYYIVDADFEITQPYNIDFSGHFHGNDHTITLSGEMTLGLFLINSGTIEKVNIYRPASLVETFLDTDVIRWGVGAAAGSIASYNSGTITDCTVSGYQGIAVVDNKTNYYVGAIAGYNKGTITRCCSDLDIFMYAEAANVYVGGIAGANFGLIADSMNSGCIDPRIDTMDAITSGLHYAKFYVGGIAGESGGTVERCIQSSTVETAASCYTDSDGYFVVRHSLQCGFIVGGEFSYGTESYTVNKKYVRNCYVQDTSTVSHRCNSYNYAYFDSRQHTAEETSYTVLDWDGLTALWEHICLDADYETSFAYVRKLVEWDADSQIAYFDSSPEKNPENQGYQVMEETDTSFLENVGALVGNYVLAETRARKDGLVAPGILLDMKPVETRTGTITAFGEGEIAIDNNYFAVMDRLYPLFFSVGDFVVYHLYNGVIAGISMYQEDSEEPEYEMAITPGEEPLMIQVGKTLKLKCRLYRDGVRVLDWEQPEASVYQGDMTSPVSLVGWEAMDDASYELTLLGESLGNTYLVIDESTGGTSRMILIEVTQAEEEMFKKPIYHADHLLEDEVVHFDDLIRQINQYSPAAYVLNNAGVDDWAGAWDDWTLLYDSLIKGDEAVKREFEQREVYEAILLTALECATRDQSAVAWGLSNVKEAVSAANELLSWTEEILQLKHDLDLAADTKLISMSEKTKDAVKDSLEEALEKGGFAEAVSNLKEAGDFLGEIMEISTTAEDLVKKTMTYIELWYVSDSMAGVLDEILKKIPDTSEFNHMREATQFCSDMIRETSREQFLNYALMHADVLVGGEYALTEGTAYFWDKLREKVIAENPKLTIVLLGYKAGRTVTDHVIGLDNITEQVYKLRVVNQYIFYLESAMLQIKKQYLDDRTEENANTLLHAVALLHAFAAEECDIAYQYADVADESKIERILDAIGDFLDQIVGKPVEEEANVALKQYASATRDFFVHNNVDAATHWVYHLEEDYPEYYPDYAALIGDSRYDDALVVPLSSDYVIECPVDVRVYSESGELAADLCEPGMYSLGDVSAIQIGDRKVISIMDGTSYSIVCEGYDQGVMKITAREYMGPQKVRDVVFHELKVTADSIYELKTRTDPENKTVYTVACEDRLIPADLDTGIEKCAEHVYGVPIFEWNADHSCDAWFICSSKDDVMTRACTITVETIPATQDEDGMSVYTAAVEFGGKTYTDTKTLMLPALNHKHRFEAVVRAPACTKRGYTTYICACGERYTGDRTEPLGHDFAEWIVLREPTEEEKGVEERTCSRCGHAEQRSIPRLEKPVLPKSYSNQLYQKTPSVYGKSRTSFLDELSDGGYQAVFYVENILYIVNYNSDWEIVDNKTVDVELPRWGGFYSGDQYNYVVCGQPADSTQEEGGEVYRIIKYDKDFQRLGSISLSSYDTNTATPFKDGNVSIDESNGVLTVYTSRQRRNGNQTSFAIQINTSDMTVHDDTETNSMPGVYAVSSFRQIVNYDGDDAVYVDLMDGSTEHAVYLQHRDDLTLLVNLNDEAGDYDANAELSGLEISDTHFFVIGSRQVDYEQNIFLSIVNKATKEVETIWLTGVTPFESHTLYAPRITKIGGDRYAVLWNDAGENAVRYLILDSQGNILGEEKEALDLQITDCEPIFSNGIIIWVTADAGIVRTACIEDLEETGTYEWKDPIIAADDPWDGTSDISWYDEKQTEFAISTPEQMAGLSELAAGGNTFAGKTVHLVNDLFMNDSTYAHEWTAILNWEGTFNGNGHAIYNIYQDDEKGGLFDTVGETGIVKALTLAQGVFGTGGCVADVNKGIIAFCFNRSLVYSDSYSRRLMDGGICDENYNLVYGCRNYGRVMGDSVAGIVGLNKKSVSVVSQCSNWGSVAGYNDASGIVGFDYGWIYNCYAKGTIMSTIPGNGNEANTISGIFSDRNSSGDVESCYSVCAFSYHSSTYCRGRYRIGPGTAINCYSGYSKSPEQMREQSFVELLNQQTNLAFPAWVEDADGINNGLPITIADDNYARGNYRIQPELWIDFPKKLSMKPGESKSKSCETFYNEEEIVITVADTSIAEASWSNGVLTITGLKEGETEVVIHFNETENGLSAEHCIDILIASYEGYCGDGLKWCFDPDTGVLSITGEGSMTNYSDFTGSEAPWYDYRKQITAIQLDDRIVSIGSFAFRDCSEIGEIIIPDNVTTINRFAFEGCSGLKEVAIPKNTTSLGAGVFRDCTKLERVDVDPANVNYISDEKGVVYDCAFTTLVIVPYAISGEYVIAEGVEKVGSRAFENRDCLTQVTFPTTLREIDYSAFGSCGKLKYIIFTGDAPEIENDAFSYYCLTGYYPMDNETWTQEKRDAYCGGTITWKAMCASHEWNSWVTDWEATCTRDGQEWRDCNNCEYSEYRTIAAIGHSFGEWVLIQKPTAGEAGVEERACTHCGHTEQRMIASLEKPFNDVAPGSFYYEPVMWAIENGITNGTSATTFGPNDQCMRAHVVTFLWRAVGCPEPTRTDNPFVDVKPTDFYYKPVLWALENGITSGMDATHFGPTSYCNRAQVVTFLYRTMGNPDVAVSANPFVDVAAGSFYERAVLWAVENGITNGLSASEFGPNSICNRAQIVTFLYRAFVD